MWNITMKIHRMRGGWSDKGQFYHVWDVLYAIMDHRGLAPGIWVNVYGNQTSRAGDSSWGYVSGKEGYQI